MYFVNSTLVSKHKTHVSNIHLFYSLIQGVSKKSCSPCTYSITSEHQSSIHPYLAITSEHQSSIHPYLAITSGHQSSIHPYLAITSGHQSSIHPYLAITSGHQSSIHPYLAITSGGSKGRAPGAQPPYGPKFS